MGRKSQRSDRDQEQRRVRDGWPVPRQRTQQVAQLRTQAA